MENKKYVKKSFWVHQYETEALFLSNMRAKGWKFVKLHKGIPTKYEFDKCEPEKYVYQLDYVETDKDTEDYHQLFKDSGWEEIMSWNAVGGKWYYFCKKSDLGNEKIYTDIDSKVQLLNTLWKRYCLFLLINCLLEINGFRVFLKLISYEGVSSIHKISGMIGLAFCTAGISFILYLLGAILHQKIKIEKQRENVI